MPLALFSSRVVKNSLKPHSSSRRALRRAAGLGLGFLSLLSVSAAHAGPVNWDNTAGDWFANPTHWSNGSTPGAGDDAVNMSTAAMTLGQSTTVNSFFSNGAFTLQGGTFTGNQANSASTITVNNVFTVNGGGISNFTVDQGAGGSVVFGNNGNNFVDNTVFNSSISLTADAYTRLYDTDTFNGTITLNSTGNGIQLQDSSTSMVIGGTGSLNGYGSIYQVYDGTVTNNGTINANAATQTLALSIDHFNNAGTAEATAAGSLLALNDSSGTNTGTFAASGGGMIGIHGSITSGANSQYNAAGGTILVDGGNLTGTVGSTTGTGLTFSNNGNNYLNNATINGTLTFSAPDAYTRLYGTVTENGAINLSTTANGIQLQDSNTNLINNGSLTGYGNLYQVYDGTITNNGTLNANSSGNALTQNVDHISNSSGATLEATSGGILDLNTNTVNSGTIAAKSGGIVNISDSLVSNAGSLLDGASGTFNLQNAQVTGTLTGTAGTTLNFGNSGNNSINNGTPATILNTDLTFNNDAYTRIYGTVTSNNTIHFNSTANGIQLQDSNTNLINNGSLLGYGTIYQVYDGTVTNNGTLNANSSGNALTFSIDNTVNSAGAMLEATSGGVLNLANNTTNSGTITAGAGSTVNIANNFVSSTGSLIDGTSGTFNLQNAQVTGTVTGTAGTVLNFGNSGNNSISGATLNTDTKFNADAYTRLYGTVTDNNAINLSTTANGIQLQDSNTNLSIGGTGSLNGYGTIYQVYDGTVTNNGTLNANSSGNALTQNVDHISNSSGATLEATSGGILDLNTNTVNSGTIAAKSGGIVNISDSLVSNAGSLLDGASGTFNLQNIGVTGTVTGTTGTVLNFGNSGNNSISGATLNTDTKFNADAYTRLYGTVTDNNAINLSTTANGIQLQDSNTNLSIGGTGSLNGYGTIYQVYDGTVTNNGTVNASGGTLNINTTAFSNTGTTEVQNGAVLSVTSANTDSGNILVKTGGTATFTQGVAQTAGLTQVDGTLNSPLTLTGGTLAGTGTVVGNVTNTSATDTGGTVSAGNSTSPFGTLTVNGSFTQQTGGALDANFSSTQNNLLAVMGAVTTGGVLNVNYLGSGPYTGSGPFTFLDYTTLMTSIAGTGPTQYFANETFLDGTGVIDGSNGFTYELLDTTPNELQLQVLNNGAPVPAVPEASTTVSLGALLLLGGAGLWRAKRRTTGAAD